MGETIDLEEKKRLSVKGLRDAIQVLLEQAVYSMNLADTYMSELEKWGFTREMLAAMSGTYTTLSKAMGERRDGQVDAQLATGDEHGTQAEAKALVFRLRQLIPIVTRGAKRNEAKEQHLSKVGPIGSSTPKLVTFLKENREVVARFDNKLTPYNGGQSPLVQLDKLVLELDEKQGNQNAAQVVLPAATFELRVLKGQLLEMIEDLNRIGRVAFYGRAEIAGKFNKDILLRARRPNGKAGGESEANVETDEVVPA